MQLKYRLDDVPPPVPLALFGLQWFAVSIPGIIIIGKIVAGLHFAGPAGQIAYLQKLSFVTGAFLLVQVLLGHRLPLILGPSSVLLIGTMTSAGFGAEVVNTSVMVGGALLFGVAASGLFGRLQGLFTPRVVAVVLLLIAFTLAPTALGLIVPGGALQPGRSMAFAFLLILAMLACQHYLPAIWKSAIIFLAMAAGSFAWSFVFSSSGLLPDHGLPFFSFLFGGFTTGLSFVPGVLAAFIFCFFGLSINDLGSIESMSAVVEVTDMEKRVDRGVTVTGLANLVSGFFGVMGPVNFSLSPGVILSTGCASRFTLVVAACLLLVISFSPFLLGIVGAVPGVVVGAVFIYILAFQMAAGLASLGREEKGFHLDSGVVVGLPVLVGTLAGIMPAHAVAAFPLVVRPIVGNGFVVGVVLALLLEHVVYRGSKGAGRGRSA